MRLLKIGRDSACDIVLHSDKASALHAELTILNNGDILLEDKNSRNGTFVMNRPIRTGTQVSVKRGDAIRFGDVELIWDQVPHAEDLSQYKAVYGIGTSMRNDVQITGNTVSRYHATLKIAKNGKAFFQDHSKNGSTINGERLNPGQTRHVKRGDSIVCGGVPVNLSQFIPGNPWGKIMRVAAVAVVLVLCVLAAKFIPWSGTVSPKTIEAMEHASACVYGGYYYIIELSGNKIFEEQYGLGSNKWYIGSDGKGGYNCSQNKNDLYPLEYTGTAFFISDNGELGTNRHVAYPWKYISNEEASHFKQLVRGQVIDILNLKLKYEIISNIQDAQAELERFLAHDANISGSHAYFGIGLTGSKINSVIDLQHAQVIAESGDPNKDVALIRLNSRKTPDYIVNMGAVYDIGQARVDETSLVPHEDELIVTGYPKGEAVSSQLFNGQELRPTSHKTSISRMPDDNQMQIQTVGVGGFSGSPVIDEDHRLVGVLCSGFGGTEVTYCCNIKHLVELYNKYKVR